MPHPDHPATFFDRNGYRHTYETQLSTSLIGLVVIGVAEKLGKARRLARKAHAKLDLGYDELPYDPAFGFGSPESRRFEQMYPGSTRRRPSPVERAYISIEQGRYDQWRRGEFIVIAAYGIPGSDLLRATLTKAKAVFPEAHEVTTRKTWILYTYTKLPEEASGATERGTALSR